MACGIVALGYKDVVFLAGLDWLVQWDRRAQKLLLDLAEAVKPRLKLEVVVAVALGNGGNDGDVVSLGADVVRRRNDGDVDVYAG